MNNALPVALSLGLLRLTSIAEPKHPKIYFLEAQSPRLDPFVTRAGRYVTFRQNITLESYTANERT